jgi:hypothetical protein
MKDNTTNFFVSLFLGAILMVGLLILLGATPNATMKKCQQEAVDKHHGEWYVSTNGSNPTIEFRWLDHDKE